MAMFRLTSEASTIFINIRWMLLTFKMKDTKFYLYNALIGTLVFFVFRIVTIIPSWYMLLTLVYIPEWKQVPFIYKIISIGGSIPLDGLNLFWFYRIICIAIKYSKPSREQKKTE